MLAEFIEALTIIAKQEPDADISAQHDVIYVGSYNPDDHTPEDVARLKALLWHEEYESWCRYT